MERQSPLRRGCRVWVVVLLLAFFGNKVLGDVYSDNFTLPSNPAQQGANLLKARLPARGGQGAGQIVFTVGSGSLASDRAAIEASIARVRQLPNVLSASDPFSPLTVARNGRIAYSSVHFSTNPQNLGASYVAEIDSAVAPARHADVTVNYEEQLGSAARPKSLHGCR